MSDILKKSLCSLGLILSDILAVLFSFAIAYYMRSWLLVQVFHIFPPMIHGINVYLGAWAFFLLWLLVFAYEGLYPSIGIGIWEETKKLLRSNVLVFIILVLFTFITKTSIHFSRSVIVLAFMSSLILLPLLRHLTRSVLMYSGLWQKNVLIVGLPDTIEQVLCNLRKHPDWGLIPIGIVMPEYQEGVYLIDIPVYRGLGHMNNPAIKAEEVIVAMPHLSRSELVDMVERAMTVAPVVKVLPDLYGIASAGVKTHDLDGMLLLEMEDRLAMKRNAVVKRMFDIICSFTGLVLFSPLFLLIMSLIKIDTGGPTFFGHKRLGKGGIPFICYKFRTMLTNAQDVLNALLENDPEVRSQWEKDFKLKNDPRITRIGAFLRKTSLDELPQLWNVLMGEMSLVGPRPIVTDEMAKYGEKTRYLFKVPPGITGLWQVSGRNDIDYGERILLDEYYAKNWSLWLDIEVLIRTVGAVLKKEGAY